MMSNNKILTVSYGTFSCTLEGFDDSFGTMKAIAEYFRDLAADDRYFGAEPPQPDAEMLTRIAEREISRRVEAREHEGRIVLSASDAAAAPALAASAMAEQPAQDTSPREEVVTDAAPVQEAEAEAPEAEVEAPVEEAVVEAAVAETVDVETEDSAEQDDADDTDDLIASVADAVADTDDTDEDVADEVASATSDADASAEAFFANVKDSASDVVEDAIEEDADDAATAEGDDATDAQDDIAAEDITSPTPAVPDSIAAKLQRIRAVVSQSQQEAEAEELFEDEHAEDLETDEIAPIAMDMDDAGDDVESADALIEDAARDIEAAQRIDDDVQTQAKAASDDDEEDDVAAILARFDTSSDADLVKADAAQAPETADEGEDDLGLDSLAALMAADDGQADDEDAGENIFDATEEDAAPRRARIVKVKRADIDAALASGQLEEVEDDDDDADSADASSLSEQDEAELLAELAQVEAELPAGAAEGDAMDADSDDAAMDAVASQGAEVEAAAPVKDDDVSRLMAEADNQMDEPEGSSRRNAFAHLKAAVAAKKADADIGNDSIKDEGAFRSDLASVVKPRRPEAAGTRDARPEGPRPAPLKLVPAQRVDADAAPKGPVRPRRVAAVEDAVAEVSADGSFADYAADLGAHNLPALLEAAASYLSFVEGRDQFSRPQLMNKVRQVEKDEFSREDGLRSFGQLLRAGKIEKMKGGRFAVTNDIGYRPDQRAAG